MHAGLYATKIQAAVMKDREEIESAYDRYAEATLFWAFIDLVGSTNYRISNGPKAGYIRAETFFSLIASTIAPCIEVRSVKEIGDAVLLSSTSFRPLLECIFLIDQATAQLAFVAGDQQFPFGIRAGIGFGPAKRLSRRHEDFVGTPIDSLARLMGVRSPNTNLLLHEDAYVPSRDIFQEYTEFLIVSASKMVSSEKSKDILRPVYYRELVIDRKSFVEFRGHFTPWKKS